MSTPKQPLTAGRILFLVLASPFLAAYGLVVLARAVRGAFRRARGARAALAAAVRCPNGHPNETVGRWACAACGSTYHGWVGRCGVCGAPAGRIDCAACGVGVRLPWSAS